MSEKISVLVVGGGSIGERHVRCFLATGRADVSLCEIDDAVRTRVAAHYDLPASDRELARAIERHPQVAVVATPAHLHVTQARQLVDAGCHVLIEKPLSTSLEGVEPLGHAAAAARSTVGVGYVLRHNPGIASIKDALTSAQFGRPLELIYVGGQHFPTYRPAYREIYYRDHATGGGAVQDALTHMLNAAGWLLGPIDAVAAQAAHLALEGVEVEDTVHVLARHGNVLASYALNQHQAPNESRLWIHCEAGTLYWQPHANRWMSMQHGRSSWDEHPYDFPERDTGFVAQAHAFLDAAAGRASVACPVDEAAATLRACLAILKAAAERRWVEVHEVAGGTATDADT